MAVASSGRPTDVNDRRLNAGQPFRADSVVNFANGLTTLRLLAVVPIGLLIQSGHYAAAFWLFLAAGLTDVADGFIAKRFAGISRVGVVLDPVADKMLLVGIFLVLSWQGVVPSWLLGLVVARDLLLSLGTLVLRARVEGFEIVPSLLGKACTFAQLIYVGAVLAEAGRMFWFASDVATMTLPLMALLTIASGCAYMIGAVRIAVTGAARS
ncbi:MAG TPA: CDP-alcohol phosphatidyltransferase family protein [Geminicoccus sp.]|jgi:cardiolipin synthase|uniref:CDP-alcohol phosphatidyltransferase family protein n=1 Tax=Geminicoccus sp. TaxID=2024832 RepID=UPI002E37D315|nr:CDP-alcohol phosphatidyltransferase family protein [Geminicoccus sp.]HEX2525072.1 CDP-alcohol phosphatidyltransferase family protein [Geminicoccus sp.]